MSTPVPDDLVFLQWLIDECDYRHPKLIGQRRWAAIERKMFTWALLIGRLGDRYGHDDRFCYRDYQTARAALEAWDGTGEPVGWIRHPATGRRFSTSPDERDGKGRRMGAVGVMYINH